MDRNTIFGVCYIAIALCITISIPFIFGASYWDAKKYAEELCHSKGYTSFSILSKNSEMDIEGFYVARCINETPDHEIIGDGYFKVCKLGFFSCEKLDWGSENEK